MDYNVVIRRSNGVHTWTSYPSKGEFEARRDLIDGEVIAAGVSREYAILKARLMPGKSLADAVHSQIEADPVNRDVYLFNACWSYWDGGENREELIYALKAWGYESALESLSLL